MQRPWAGVASPGTARSGLPPPPLRPAAPSAPASVARSVFMLSPGRRFPPQSLDHGPQRRPNSERRPRPQTALEQRNSSLKLPPRVKQSHISISQLLLSAPARMSPDKAATPPGHGPPRERLAAAAAHAQAARAAAAGEAAAVEPAALQASLAAASFCC